MTKIRFIERHQTEEHKAEQERLMLKEMQDVFKILPEANSNELSAYSDAWDKQ